MSQLLEAYITFLSSGPYITSSDKTTSLLVQFWLDKHTFFDQFSEYEVKNKDEAYRNLYEAYRDLRLVFTRAIAQETILSGNLSSQILSIANYVEK